MIEIAFKRHRINTDPSWCTSLDNLDIHILQLGLNEVYVIFGVSEIISLGLGKCHPFLKLSFARTSGCYRTFPPVKRETTDNKDLLTK